MTSSISAFAWMITLLQLSGIYSSEEYRIIGGNDAKLGEIPHQVFLAYKVGNKISVYCGGTIIGNNTILTAAHCVTGDHIDMVRYPEKFCVGGGITDLKNVTRVYNIEEAIPHPKYYKRSMEYDIALIKVKETFKFNANMSSVALSKNTPTDRTNCTVSGWGVQEFNASSISHKLKAAQVLIVNIEECSRNYSKHFNSTVIFNSRTMLCAADPQFKKDACQGDSGGPLVCNGEVAGVVSSGFECAHPGLPGIYTNVAHFKKWIQSNGCSKIHDLTHYLTLPLLFWHLLYYLK